MKRVLGLVSALCLLLDPRAAAQLVVCAPPLRQGCPVEPEPALLPYWKQVPDHAGWQMLLSPAFPQSWPPPPAGRGSVVRYAFATRLKPGVVDGAEMAAPWARVMLDARGIQRVERLTRHLRPLGLQGVRPLGTAEIALADREQDVAELLLTGGTPATDNLVRELTCGWISRQGVVAAAITPLHPGFTRWLACPGNGR
jgi:hypothetical protein